MNNALITFFACMACIGWQAMGFSPLSALGLAMVLAGLQAIPKTHQTIDKQAPISID